jgi:hypothetical protein
MENTKMVKFEADVAFDDENFEDVLVRLSNEMPNVYVRVLQSSSHSGWPRIEVLIPETSIAEFAEWYCADDAAIWEDEFRHEAAEV